MTAQLKVNDYILHYDKDACYPAVVVKVTDKTVFYRILELNVSENDILSMPKHELKSRDIATYVDLYNRDRVRDVDYYKNKDLFALGDTVQRRVDAKDFFVVRTTETTAKYFSY